jgi:3-isopropylmalate/(R)-2-methylmalate dehydratase large subunit
MAKASDKRVVSAGDIVTVRVDVAGINDLYPQVLYSFRDIGKEKVWDPLKVLFFFDHYAPAPTIKSAAIHQEMREFAAAQGIQNVFDVNAGVCHQVTAEAGFSRPGKVMVITDSHSTTHGAFGAFGTGVGATDQAAILASGMTWMMVPEVIAIKINGKLPVYVGAKDIVLKVLGEIGQNAANYKAVEFMGETVKDMSVAERMVLCNMAVEMGAKTAYIQPSSEVLDYVKQRTNDFEVFETDKDYKYTREHVIDVSDLEPQVAIPHSIDTVLPVRKCEKRMIDQAFIGTCTGGRLEDIAVSASILEGRTIAKNIRLVVIPASSQILLEAMEKGYVQTLLKAGATISTPGCGPCLGAHQGALASGEACITTSSRNFPGRMGSIEAEIYVASPATVASTALHGYLTDSRG